MLLLTSYLLTIKKATYFHENRIKVAIHKTEQVAFSFNLFLELCILFYDFLSGKQSFNPSSISFPFLLYWLYYNPVHSPNNHTHLHNTFTNSTALFISSSSGCPLAIPPTSLNGPNVS